MTVYLSIFGRCDFRTPVFVEVEKKRTATPVFQQSSITFLTQGVHTQTLQQQCREPAFYKSDQNDQIRQRTVGDMKTYAYMHELKRRLTVCIIINSQVRDNYVQTRT